MSVNGNLEKKRTSLCWGDYPVDIAKQYRLCCPGLAGWQERRTGNEIRLCKFFCSIELLVDWHKTFIWGGHNEYVVGQYSDQARFSYFGRALCIQLSRL